MPEEAPRKYLKLLEDSKLFDKLDMQPELEEKTPAKSPAAGAKTPEAAKASASVAAAGAREKYKFIIKGELTEKIYEKYIPESPAR